MRYQEAERDSGSAVKGLYVAVWYKHISELKLHLFDRRGRLCARKDCRLLFLCCWEGRCFSGTVLFPGSLLVQLGFLGGNSVWIFFLFGFVRGSVYMRMSLGFGRGEGSESIFIWFCFLRGFFVCLLLLFFLLFLLSHYFICSALHHLVSLQNLC